MSRHLMARFRHLQAADESGLDFDWKPHPHFSDHYLANLENGDWIGVGPELPQPHHEHPYTWSYGIYGPLPAGLDKHNLPYDYEKGHFVQNSVDDESPGDNNWVLGTAPQKMRFRNYPMHGARSPEEAMHSAEAHYKTLNRRDVTPSHQEDYDLNDIMRRFDQGEL